MSEGKVLTYTGCLVEELSIEGIMDGSLGAEDMRISADTLLRQAEAAEAAGNLQLGRNFRRAAELTGLSNREMLEIYNTLRPGRTSFRQLQDLAGRLESEHKAVLNAALVREAAEVYLRRGLIKEE